MEEKNITSINTNFINKHRLLLTTCLASLMVLIVIYAISLFNKGIVSNYWPLAIALPISLITIILSRKIPKQNKYIRSLSFYSGLITFLIFLFATTMMILFSRYEKKDFSLVNEIQGIVDFEFPDQGRIITKDFKATSFEKSRYKTLSRVFFTDGVLELEQSIAASDKWTSSLSVDMLEAIPNYLVSQASYYLLFNIDTHTYNSRPLVGVRNYIIIYYYQDGEMSIIEYKIEITEEVS